MIIVSLPLTVWSYDDDVVVVLKQYDLDSSFVSVVSSSSFGDFLDSECNDWEYFYEWYYLEWYSYHG